MQVDGNDHIIVNEHRKVQGDGNCLFRSLSLALYDTENEHVKVRREIVGNLEKNKELYKPYIDGENFERHIEKMARDGEWGTQAELFAASETFKRDIYVRVVKGAKMEWHRYVIGECDSQHKKNYITLQWEKKHFNLITTAQRPCSCKSGKNEKSNTGPTTMASASFEFTNKYATRNGLQEMKTEVDRIYGDVVFWKSNLYEPPRSNAARALIREMTNLINDYVANAPHQCIIMKLLMIMPHLLLQKKRKHTKEGENTKLLERRLSLWKSGEWDILWKEAAALNKRINVGKPQENVTENSGIRFAKYMKQGNVGSALRILEEGNARGILPLSHTVRKELQDKHPEAKAAMIDTKLHGPILETYSGYFEDITGSMIWSMALKTKGAAGPSGLNADNLRGLLSEKRFGQAAIDLRRAMASLAKKMATEICPDIEALIARRLIPLDKNPGVRPIGIGEVMMRIIGKCMMAITKDDVKEATGNLQVCVGHQAGGEAAIHAMKKIFLDNGTEAAIIVDATNAFNSINREAMINNIAIKSPELYT